MMRSTCSSSSTSGEQVLILGARLQVAHGLVADFQEIRARHRVLVLLEPLENELLIRLLEGSAACGARASFPWQRARSRGHGRSAWLDVHGHFFERESFFIRSSTASAIACASATFAAGSTQS